MKDNNHSVGDGIQQGLGYAVTLNVPFVFSSNGDGSSFTIERDESDRKEVPLGWIVPLASRTLGKVLRMERAHPEEEKIVLQDYFDDGSGKGPALLPITPSTQPRSDRQWHDRILLVMATGTGKT